MQNVFIFEQYFSNANQCQWLGEYKFPQKLVQAELNKNRGKYFRLGPVEAVIILSVCMQNLYLKNEIFEYTDNFYLFVYSLAKYKFLWILKDEMFYLSRSVSTDGDFWNSAGLEAFISQQRGIHPADVGGERAYSSATFA